MLVDQLERGDVAILDAALSAERLELRPELGRMAPPAREADSGQSRFGAARVALSGVLLGFALWAPILTPIIRH